MKLIVVSKNEAGQRFDKLLGKHLNLAPKSFLYKMLRKKNITLNGKKADGSEKVQIGDEVKLFLSEDTIQKFSSSYQEQTQHQPDIVSEVGTSLGIIYEDEHILILNKPVGMLSQKAQQTDVSVVEHVIAYLLSTKQITLEELNTFRPSICNRLDRNTSGLMIAGKTLVGLQTMASAFKERSLHKYYRCIVKGRIEQKQCIQGYLVKDERANKVSIVTTKSDSSDYIETEYEPVQSANGYTLLSVRLITGKTHQIRAHLSSIGHPILGDTKYGAQSVNDWCKKTYGLKHQLLHSYQMELPELNNELHGVSGQIFVANEPKQFLRIQSDLFS